MTPATESLIREMAARSCSYSEISRETGTHPSAVRRYVTKHALPRRPKHVNSNGPKPETKDRVLARLERGDALMVIVREEGVAKRTVQKWRAKANLDPDFRRYRPEEDVILREAVAAGKAVQEIVLPGRTINSIKARMTLLGLTVVRVKKMAAEGCSNPVIAAALGMSASNVKSIRAKHGIKAHTGTKPKGLPPPVRPPPRTPDPWLVNGYRMVGLHEAQRWYRENGGRGWAEMGAINDLRRRKNRAPFSLLPGKLTVGGKT